MTSQQVGSLPRDAWSIQPAGLDGSGPAVPVGPACTTLVGPNALGKGRLLAAIADALAGRAAPGAASGPVLVAAEATNREMAARVDASSARFAATLLAEARAVVPEVDRVEATVDGDLLLLDDEDRPFGVSGGFRASVGLAVARELVAVGTPPVALLVEEPGAFLHPLAQEELRGRLSAFAADTGVRVVLTSESTFVVPRGPADLVVAMARDADGRMVVLGWARGDDRHADLVGGLFRDPGLAAVLDRAATLGEGVEAVLVVEGGTDEAYLRTAARVLGREADLAGMAVVAAGGASAAALQAVVLRAETALPLLVLLDNDDPGRRARDTLVKRLSFARRREATTYAEVLPGYPEGAEAEDMFAPSFVGRFVRQQGPRSTTGRRELLPGVVHHDLTSGAKSAFVAWADQHATPDDVVAWGAVLDLLVERLAPDDDGEPNAGGVPSRP